MGWNILLFSRIIIVNELYYNFSYASYALSNNWTWKCSNGETENEMEFILQTNLTWPDSPLDQQSTSDQRHKDITTGQYIQYP